MQLSENFSLEEFSQSQTASRLGIDNSVPKEILKNLVRTANCIEIVRELLGTPVIITSAYRCPALNEAIGGSPTSDHPNGFCVDFISPQFGSPYEIASAIAKSGIKFDQLILEYGWVHISSNPAYRGEILTKKSAASKYQHGLIK